MKLVKYGREAGANAYEVYAGDKLYGWLYRERYAGSGHWMSGYVGTWKGGFEWVFGYADDDHVPTCRHFDTQKEAKQYLVRETA